MSNELTKSEENKIALMNQQEMAEVIKPLSQEIHLFDTYISGTLTMKNPDLINSLNIGDRLILKREETVYDANTIGVYNQANEKLGYVPEKDNVVFARLMDAGKCLMAKVSEIKEKTAMKIVTIGIYLVDF